MESVLRSTAWKCLVLLWTVCAGVLLLGTRAWADEPGTWTPAGALVEARSEHSATLLVDGRVLIAGGRDGSRRPTSVAELFDPSTGSSTRLLSRLPVAVAGHTATRLADGSVIIVGGIDAAGNAVATAQRFDPAGLAFTPLPGLITARSGHTATLTADGRIVIAGGTNRSGALASLETYDPALATFAAAPGVFQTPRSLHTATVLDDGRILFAGGADDTGALDTAEIFDPLDGSLIAVSPMIAARARASAALLADGTVLIAGGQDERKKDLDTAEIFDPATRTFRQVVTRLGGGRSGHAGLALPDNGRVLIVGGTTAGRLATSVESYDPVTGRFVPVRAPGAPRQAADTVFPWSGVLLVTGGLDTGRRPITAVEALRFPTLRSDQLDYHPGDTVTLTGLGWRPGETVTISIHESSGDADTLVTVAADDSGAFVIPALAIDAADIGVRFLASAVGQGSGWTAQTRFTDAGKIASVSAGSQSPRPVTAGTVASYTVTVKRASGTTGAGAFEATLSVTSGLPAGTAAAFTPNPLPFAASDTSKAAVLTVTTSTTSPAGRTTLKIVATNPALAGDSKYDTQTLDIAAPLPPIKLGFVTAAFTAVVGQCSPAITIQTRDSKSAPAFVAAPTLVTLTTKSGAGAFFSDAACTSPVSGVTIATGTHSASVHYRDTAVNRPAITASAPLLTAATQTETIDKAATATVVSAVPAPSVFGQPVTFTATVSVAAPGSGTPTGTVQFRDGGTAIGSPVALAAGVASLTMPALTRAAHVITATYGGDSRFLGSTAPGFTHTVDKAPTGVAMTSTPNPTVFGQSTTLKATVSVTPPGAGTLTGTVQFKADGVALGGPVVLAAGIATASTTGLPAGPHSLSAEYSGDGNFATSASPGISHTVGKAATSVSIGSSQNPTVVGRTITFTAVVSVGIPGSGTPSGTVQFMDGGVALGAPVLLTGAGTASLATSSLSAGSHSITAAYVGDANFAPSTSIPLAQFVSNSETTTALVSSANPSVTGQPVTFTATVAPVPPSIGSPTGTVQFKVDGAPFGAPVALAGASASLTTGALAVAAHTITAVYSGDADFNASTAPGIAQTVNQAATTTAVTASANPSPFGFPVTFTATVTPVAPGAGTPTGTVQFKADGALIGAPVTVAGGSASFSPPSLALAVGAHTITADYAGDPRFLASTGDLAHGVRPPTVAESTGAVNQLRADTTASAMDDRYKPNLYKTTDKAVENLTDGQAKLDAGDVPGAILKFQSARAYIDLYHKQLNDLVVKGDVAAAVGAPLLAEAEIIAAQIQAIIDAL